MEPETAPISPGDTGPTADEPPVDQAPVDLGQNSTGTVKGPREGGEEDGDGHGNA